MKSFVVFLALTGFVAVQGQFTCEVPDCTIVSNRPTLWPHEKPVFFYRCVRDEVKGWSPVEVSCQCGNLFSFLKQGCVLADTWVRVCSSHEAQPPPDSCSGNPTTVAPGPTEIPTVPVPSAAPTAPPPPPSSQPPTVAPSIPPSDPPTVAPASRNF